MASKILVALRVKATPARAFEVFTTEVGLWWRPNPLFEFTPRGPGVLAFEPGEGGRLTETLASGKVFEIGRVRAWEPPRRLVFGWRQAAFEPGQDDPRLHPTRQARVVAEGCAVGVIGQIHPEAAEAAGLAPGTFLAEVDVHALLKASYVAPSYHRLSRNPAGLCRGLLGHNQ